MNNVMIMMRQRCNRLHDLVHHKRLSQLIITGFVSFDSITYSILKCLNNISVYAYV